MSLYWKCDIFWIGWTLISLFILNHVETGVPPPEESPSTAQVSPAELRLPRTMKPKSYDLSIKAYLPDFISIPKEKEYTFDGEIQIKISVIQNTNKIVLSSMGLRNPINPSEYHIQEVSHNLYYGEGRVIKARRVSQNDTVQMMTIELEKTINRGNEIELKFSYSGDIRDSLNGFYRAPYLLPNGRLRFIASTQFEPNSARRAIPCFDEPDLKATWKIKIIHPRGTRALANGIEETENVPVRGDSNWLTSSFKETIPLSSYLVAFTVNDFEYLEGRTKNSNIRVRLWSRKNILGNMKHAMEVALKALDFYEDYYQIKFPMPKQDMIAVPNFEAGAMENMGLVTYKEENLNFNPAVDSIRSKELVARVVTHELAHQWFGNLVTMKWWDDLWLNEGFATHMEFLATDYSSDGKFQEPYNFLVEGRWKATDMDATGNSHPLSFQITKASDAVNAFDPISYHKGACFVRMLERLMGTENFKKGLKAYLKKYSYSNAAAEDLLSTMGEFVPHHVKGPFDKPFNVTTFSIPWTKQMGFPVINVKRIDKATVEFSQKRFKLDEEDLDNPTYAVNPLGYKWDIPLWYHLKGILQPTQWIPSNAQKIHLRIFDNPRDILVVNPEVKGFYRVNYDEKLWTAIQGLLERDHTLIPVNARENLIEDAFALAAADQLPYATAIKMTSYIGKETERIPWQAAFKGILKIQGNFGPPGPGNQEIRTYMIRRLEKLLQKVDMDNLKLNRDEDFAKSALLLDMVGICIYLRYDECTSKLRKIFKKDFESHCKPTSVASECSKIPSDIRANVYCEIVASGDRKTFEKMRAYFERETNVNEKNSLLGSLGCSADKEIIEGFLMDAVMGNHNIRLGDIPLAFVMTSIQPVGSQLVPDFIIKNWGKIREKLNDSLLTFQAILMFLNIRNQEQLDRVQAFLAANKATTDDIAQWPAVVGKAQATIAWLKRNRGPLEEYFREQNHKSTSKKRRYRREEDSSL